MAERAGGRRSGGGVDRRRWLAAAAAGTALAVVLGAGAARAQTADQTASAEEGTVEEIVVTARRVAESLQNVPATVSVLTSRTIETAGIERVEDYVALTPGVTIVTNTAEVADSQVNIRGINGARDAENNYALIIDGVLRTNPAALNREYSDLQQIEVLKGPQGALYGRNAAAGAIVITTKKPGNEVEGEVKVSGAEDNTFLVSGSLSGPLVKDELFVRLHADYRTSDGYYRNSFLDSKTIDGFEGWNIDGRILWEPSAATSLDTQIHYGEVDANAIVFNASFQLPAFAEFLGVPEFFEDVNDHRFVFQPNITSFNNQTALELSTKLDHDLEWATLTAWLLYSDIDNNFGADGTSGAFGFFNDEPTCRQTTAELFAAGVTLPPPQILGPVPEFSIFGPYTPTSCDGTQFQVRNQEDVSFELRLASPAGQALRWLAGVYYLHIDREVGVNLGIDKGAGITRALFVPPSGANPTEQLVHDNFRTNVYAVFGQLAYDLTPDLEGSVALRYDREVRRVRNLVPTDARTQFVDFDGPPFTGGAPLNPGLSPIINPSGVIPPQKRAFEQVQPKVSLTWRVDPEWTLFANWGVGFRSGGFNNLGSAATVDLFFNSTIGAGVKIADVFRKETSNATEAGFRGRLFGGRLRLEGAYYHTIVDDMQFFEFFVGPFGLLRVVSNIDKVRIDGFEVSANARPASWLDLYAAFNFTDSSIKRNDSRPDTVGNKSPLTAKYTLNGGAMLTLPVLDDVDWILRADGRLTGPTWFHTVQDEQRPTIFGVPADYSVTRRDAFFLLDLRTGFETARWSLMAFATNLTKERYLAEVIPAIEFGGSFVSPGALRRFGAEFRVKF